MKIFMGVGKASSPGTANLMAKPNYALKMNILK